MGEDVIATQYSRRRTIAAGVVGNMLEWYDFSIYGFFAVQIGAAFFHTDDRVVQALSAFGVFALGFLTRPIGSIVIGHIGDRHGRTTALTISIVGMAVATVGMGLIPAYATIGVAAPILLTVMRMLQGLAVGGEAAIAGVFMIEQAPRGRRALSGAIGGIGNGLGIQAGSLTALALAGSMPPAALAEWGWRIPFVLGIVVGVGGFFVRRALRDMPDHTSESKGTPIVELFRDHLPLLLRIAGLACFTAIGFQAAFIYIADWLQIVDGIAPHHAFQITSTSMLLITPVSLFFGWLADHIGRKGLLLVGAAIGVIGSVPFFMLMQNDSHALIYVGQIGFVLAIGIQFGVLQALMVETTPQEIRCTALAVGNNIAWSILGGTTPLVATWLVYRTEDERSPAYLIAAAAAITFVALLATKDNFKNELRKPRPVPRRSRLEPALHAAALAAPAQHAARQVGDVGEARLLQDRRGMGRAAAGAADRHDRSVPRQLLGAGRELAQRHQGGAVDVPKRPGEFVRLAHVEHLHGGEVLFEPVRLDFPDAREGEAQRRPGRIQEAGLRGLRGVVAGPAAAQVGRHCLVDLLGVRQVEVLHVAGIVGLADLAAQSRIEFLLLADAGDGEAAIVVRRIEQAGLGQREDAAAHRAVERAGVALLEIGAARATDHYTVAGEGHALVVEHVGHAAAGMARRRPDLERALAEGHAIAVLQHEVGTRRTAGVGQRDPAAQPILHQPRAGDMIGVDMGLERPQELQPQLGHKRRIAPDLLEDGIDHHRLACRRAAQQVGVGRRYGIEELTKHQHDYLLTAERSPCRWRRRRRRRA